MATAPGAETVAALAERVERPVWVEWPRAVWVFTKRKPLGAFGGFTVIAMIVLGVLAPLVAPYGFNEQNFSEVLKAPSLSHPFGTDRLGRDMLSRIIFGARISIFIGFGSILLADAIASVLGIVSGYYGGKLDTFLQRFVDIWQSLPTLVLLISILTIIGPGQTELIYALGFLFAARFTRIIRSSVIAIKNNVYIDAAKAVGASDVRILTRYIFPNVLPTVIVVATLFLGFAIIIEASLSFLGFGVPPPAPAWGRMLAEDRNDLIFGPWLSIAPGLAIAAAVFGFNMFGDALRDVLDPRLRGTR
ncbi:MAG: ABC transporter permease [Dehalococcoidia bacterium]